MILVSLLGFLIFAIKIISHVNESLCSDINDKAIVNRYSIFYYFLSLQSLMQLKSLASIKG